MMLFGALVLVMAVYSSDPSGSGEFVMCKNARSVKGLVLYDPTTNNFFFMFFEYLQKCLWFMGGSVPPPHEQVISLS